MLNPPRPTRRRAGRPLVAALVLVVVAAGALVWAAVAFFSAGSDVDDARQELAAATERLEDLRQDGAAATRTARDQALKAGRDAVVVMNTLDYRDAKAGLDRWLEVTTGSLHDEVVSTRDRSEQAIRDAKSVTKAKALSAAVKAVDERAGTATVLVALHIDVSTGATGPTEKFIRIQGTLLRTDHAWKLDGISQVPYQ